MTVSVNPKSLTRHASLGGRGSGAAFHRARTHNAFLDRPVPEALLREALDLAKMGPTAANQQPLRVVFLRSKAAKERLRPAMAPGNVDKTMAAPVVAITGYDLEFYEHLPFLMPHGTSRACLRAILNLRRAARRRAGRYRSAISSWLCGRSASTPARWAVSTPAKVEAEFFPEGKIKANVDHQHRLWRRRETFPAQPAPYVRPDGDDPLIIANPTAIQRDQSA